MDYILTLKQHKKKFKPTKGKPAGVFGGLGRGGDRKKGCLSCVSEQTAFFSGGDRANPPNETARMPKGFFICVFTPKVKEDGAERAFRPRR